jgi:hypothetical protein
MSVDRKMAENRVAAEGRFSVEKSPLHRESLHNSTVQFWPILILLQMMNREIDLLDMGTFFMCCVNKPVNEHLRHGYEARENNANGHPRRRDARRRRYVDA